MLSKAKLKLRKKGIGGSDAPIVAGYSKWKTPVELYLEKIGYAEEEQKENERLYWGSVLEPVVAKEYAKRTNEVLLIERNTLFSDKYPFMLANLDRRIKGKNAAVECKTWNAFSSAEWGDAGTDLVPKAYLIQCAHQAIVGNLDYIDLAVLFGHDRFAIYRYERNKKLEDALIAKEHDFWHNHVLKMEPPDPASIKDNALLFPSDGGGYLEATEEITEQITEYKNLRRRIKDDTQKLEKIKTNLSSFVKNASGIICEGEIAVTWKKGKVNRTLRINE